MAILILDGVQQPAQTTATEVITELLGSSFSGSDGDTNRSYTNNVSFSSNSMIFLEGILQKTNTYGFSTTTINNDTITITSSVFDTDRVTFRT